MAGAARALFAFGGFGGVAEDDGGSEYDRSHGEAHDDDRRDDVVQSDHEADDEDEHREAEERVTRALAEIGEAQGAGALDEDRIVDVGHRAQSPRISLMRLGRSRRSKCAAAT